MNTCSCCTFSTWDCNSTSFKKEKWLKNKQLYCTINVVPATKKITDNKSCELNTNQSTILIKFSTCTKAGAVLLFNNRVLIVQSRGQKWSFPKGGIEIGESLLDCAKREVKEETSLDVELTESDRLMQKYNSTVLYFKELKFEPKIVINEIIKYDKDCSGIGWIRLSCLKKAVTKKRFSHQFNSSLKKFVKHYF